MDAGAGTLARSAMSLAGTLLDVVYPRTCAACGSPVGFEARYLCWECLAGLWPLQRPHCSICGNPAAGVIDHDYVCGLCLGKKVHFDKARSAVHFDGPIVPVMHAFKYQNAAHLSADLARLLLAAVNAHCAPGEIDELVAVPLHPRKERERTYNQSSLLARDLALQLHKPLLHKALSRTRDTGSQTRLSSAQRRDNVRGAFAALNRQWIEGRRLLLVDDVMTTGATVNECARVLKKAGAVRVCVVTVARGV